MICQPGPRRVSVDQSRGQDGQGSGFRALRIKPQQESPALTGCGETHELVRFVTSQRELWDFPVRDGDAQFPAAFITPGLNPMHLRVGVYQLQAFAVDRYVSVSPPRVDGPGGGNDLEEQEHQTRDCPPGAECDPDDE